MIKTSRQLKDKIKNLTHGDSLKSQTLLRTYMMERFLERLAVSQYNSHFVLKGGIRKYSRTPDFPAISNQAGQGTLGEVAEAHSA